MSVGVRQHSTAPESRPPTSERLPTRHIVLAAAIGAVGPVSMVWGNGPVTLAPQTRPSALLTVLAVVALTAWWLGRMARPAPLISFPFLMLAGALATWPTAGRVEGIWCVVATAAAVMAVRTLGPTATRAPTASLLGVTGVVGTALAGWIWARNGPEMVAAMVLVLSAAVGVLVPRSLAVTSAGDRWLGRLRSTMIASWHSALAEGRRARNQVGQLPALPAFLLLSLIAAAAPALRVMLIGEGLAAQVGVVMCGALAATAGWLLSRGNPLAAAPAVMSLLVGLVTATRVGLTPVLSTLSGTLLLSWLMVRRSRSLSGSAIPASFLTAMTLLTVTSAAWVLRGGRLLSTVLLVSIVAVAATQLPSHWRFTGEHRQRHYGTIRARLTVPLGSSVVQRSSLFAATLAVGLAASAGYYRVAHDPSFAIFEGLRPSDLAVHMGLVDNLRWSQWPPETLAPHPVFHLLTYAMEALVTLEVAATIVASFGISMTVLASVIVSRLPAFRGPSVRTDSLTGVAAAIVYLLFESPVLLSAPSEVLAGQVTFTQIHIWGSPTTAVALPLNILIAGFVAQVILGGEPGVERRCWHVIPPLAVLTTLAKPSFTSVLLVAVPLACALVRPRNPVRLLRRFGLFYMVPVAATIGLQAQLLSGHDVRVVVRPFQTVSQLGLSNHFPLLQFAPAVVIIACIMVWGRGYTRSPGIVLVSCALMVGVAALLLLAFEGGPPSSGDTAQPSHAAYTLLMFFSILFAVQRLRLVIADNSLNFARSAGLSMLLLVMFFGLLSGSAAWAYFTGVWVPAPV